MPMRSHSVTCHPTQVNYIYLDIDQLGPEYEGAVFMGQITAKIVTKTTKMTMFTKYTQTLKWSDCNVK